MGFFDFLNPKKAVKNKLRKKVEEKIMDMAKEKLAEITDKDERRRQLRDMISAEMRSVANEVIPGPLQGVSDSLIHDAADDLTNDLFDQLPF